MSGDGGGVVQVCIMGESVEFVAVEGGLGREVVGVCSDEGG